MKKYTLLKTDTIQSWEGKALFRIKAEMAFGFVVKGELGGYLESAKNLSDSGNAWVSGNAQVSGNAWVSGDAQVSGDARVSGDADILVLSALGSRSASLTVTFKPSIQIATGCFIGTLQQFEAAVAKTHGDNRYGKEYRATIEYIKAIAALREAGGIDDDPL